MRELLDRNMMALLDGLFLSIRDYLDVFVADAQALTAIFMLLYFGVKAFGIIAGDEKWEIMPLLRPFALALVVIYWGGFIDLFNVLTDKVINQTSRSLFNDRIDQIDAVMLQRHELLQQLAEELITRSAEVEEIQNMQQENKSVEIMGIDISGLFDGLKGYYILVMSKLKYWMINVVEYMMIAIFQACAYVPFFFQVIFAGFLVTFGPFSFAFSVLPAYRHEYAHWIARYLSGAILGGIGYIVLSLALVVLQYGLEREIEVLQYVMGDEAAFLIYVTHSDTSTLFLASLALGAVAMLTVPIISTWILHTHGVGAAVSVLTRASMSTGTHMVK